MSNRMEIDCSPQEKERIFMLLRLGAERALTLISQDEIVLKMEQAGMHGAGDHSSQDDPVLIAATRRGIRSSLIHWLNSTIENPSDPVEPYISENIVQNALSMMELGVPELMFSLDRAAQNVAWQYWMSVVFEMVEDPRELKLLLDVSFRSISMYIDGSREILQSILKDYSDDEQRASLARKRDLVVKVLEGKGTHLELAERQLGYSMRNKQCAAIVWSDEANVELAKLEKGVELFIKACGQVESLSVMTSPEVVWVWVARDAVPDRYLLSTYLKNLRGVKISYALAGEGLEGFRRAHMDALAAQRILGRLRSSASIVEYEQLRLVEMMSRDLEATGNFIGHALGSLAKASIELRHSLLVYIQSSCNASKAAESLHTHRNTLLRRLAKAEELLPRPLESNLVQVAAALELSSWLS